MNSTCARSLIKKSKSFILWSIETMLWFKTENASWIAYFDLFTLSLVSIRLGMPSLEKIISVSS